MSLPDPYYVFRALTAFGFFTQWIVMIMNGSFVAMVLTNWMGVFPTGTPVKTAWTGIWPIDFVLGLLVVFFGAVNNVADLPDLGPFFMLIDLVFSLVVFNIMTLVEDRRNRKTGALRHPARWQFLWNWCGAASVLPVYTHLYLKRQLSKSPDLPTNQTQALPFTAVWSLVISLPLLVPAVLNASPFQIQDGVLVWFFGPITLGLFQDLVSSLISASSYRGFADPVTVTYSIVGAVAAVVHIGIAAWTYVSPELTWGRIYWPNHGAVQSGPTFMTEGAMLFMQYDHVVIYLCVLALGVYLIRIENLRVIFTLIAITAIGGPGAGLAWLLCEREKERRFAEVQSK